MFEFHESSTMFGVEDDVKVSTLDLRTDGAQINMNIIWKAVMG